jgi:hypothetical protein
MDEEVNKMKVLMHVKFLTRSMVVPLMLLIGGIDISYSQELESGLRALDTEGASHGNLAIKVYGSGILFLQDGDGPAIRLQTELTADNQPSSVKWAKDGSMVEINSTESGSDFFWLLFHRQDLSTGVHFLEEPKLPDLKRVIIQCAGELPEALLIGHPERLRAFIAPEFEGRRPPDGKLEIAPLHMPDKRGWFEVNFQVRGGGGRFTGWPNYVLWFSSADRVRFQTEKIVRVENYFRDMVKADKAGVIYDRSKSIANPIQPIRLTERLPQSPNRKWHVCQQSHPPRKDGRVALFLGLANEPDKTIPILPEEVFEKPALQWAKNNCAALLTEGPPDNRLTRLLVLRKDAASGTIYMDEPNFPIEPWLHVKIKFEPDQFPRLERDDQGKLCNYRMNMVSFAKPDTHDSDGPGGLIDKNLGVIYELQAAKRDPQNGMMKVDTASPIYRISLHSRDWLRFAFREVVKIEAGRETVLYKDDGAEPEEYK